MKVGLLSFLSIPKSLAFEEYQVQHKMGIRVRHSKTDSVERSSVLSCIQVLTWREPRWMSSRRRPGSPRQRWLKCENAFASSAWNAVAGRLSHSAKTSRNNSGLAEKLALFFFSLRRESERRKRHIAPKHHWRSTAETSPIHNSHSH